MEHCCLVAGGISMKPSWLEQKKRNRPLLLTSLLNLPCPLPHTLTTLWANTYTHRICSVVDLPPPDCDYCGLLQHCYYGIVGDCDENSHRQLRTINKNKTTFMSARKGHQNKGLCWFIHFFSLHTFVLCSQLQYALYVHRALPPHLVTTPLYNLIV